MSLKPTTPISAGAAQAFDSSGLVQAMYEDRERKRSRFEKNIKDFDPSTVWHRDIPEFTDKVNKYYEFVSDNYDALSNKSRNLDKWQEMKSMENELHNFSVASKAMGQSVDKASKLMLDKAEYDTPENQQLIDDIITGNRWGGLQEGYKSGDAMNNSFMREFGKNMILDTSSMTEELQNLGVEGDDLRFRTIEGNVKQFKSPINFSQEDLTSQIGSWWDNGFMTKSGNRVSAMDIQRKYDGNIQEFAEDVTRGLKTESEWDKYTLRKDSDGGSGTTGFIVSPRQTSSSVKGATSQPEVIMNRKGNEVPTGGSTDVPYGYNTYSQGDVVTSGPKSRFQWNPGAEAFDMDGATWSGINLSEDASVYLTSVSEGAIAKHPITFKKIKLRDSEGNLQEAINYKLPKGAPLSEEMINALRGGHAAFVITDEGEVPLSMANGNDFVYQGRVAYGRSMATTTGIDFNDPTSIMSAFQNPGNRPIAMPWDDVEGHFNGFKSQAGITNEQIEEIEMSLGSNYQPEDLFMSTFTGDDTSDLEAEMKAAAEAAAGAGDSVTPFSYRQFLQ